MGDHFSDSAHSARLHQFIAADSKYWHGIDYFAAKDACPLRLAFCHSLPILCRHHNRPANIANSRYSPPDSLKVKCATRTIAPPAAPAYTYPQLHSGMFTAFRVLNSSL